MNPKDENPSPSDPFRENPHSPFIEPPASSEPGEQRLVAAPGEPIHEAYPPNLPKDLRVPWQWSDLFLFVILYFLSMFAVVAAVGLGYAATGVPLARLRAIGPEQAFFVVIVQSIQSVLMLAYLVAQMRLRFRSPFWSTIGWRPLENGKLPRGLVYLGLALGGFSLSMAVQLAAGYAGTKTKLPIEMLFQDPRSLLLLGIMAVTIAPVVEETIFRGYLYPVLARSFGVGAGVVVTGVLFGLLHAQQLWGGWVQIGLLMVVGIVFTFARAVSRTVFASFLLHVSYNLLPSLASLVEYFGLRHRIPGH